MDITKNNSHERLYYLDWLRVAAFSLLFIFHSWRPFDHFGWHIKNEAQHFIFDALTMFTSGWRMHLIFLVSGAGTWLAMRARKDAFFMDRVKRLIVPFLFGIVVIIPPQRFYEWLMFRDYQGGFWEFLQLYPAAQLEANMGVNQILWFGHLGTHLWYLPYLFLMTMLCLILFKTIREGQINFDWLKRITATRFGIYILFLPMLFCRLLLKPYFPDYTGWADFFTYLWPFIYGFIFMADRGFIDIVKQKTRMLLSTGILASGAFLYLGSTNQAMVQAYMRPEFDSLHVLSSVLAVVIALSWTLFFLGLFAKTMTAKHHLLVPANISILPIYILHQTLIILFGYYIISLELSLFIKFILITITAIPASVFLYKLIETNRITRFLFGLK